MPVRGGLPQPLLSLCIKNKAHCLALAGQGKAGGLQALLAVGIGRQSNMVPDLEVCNGPQQLQFRLLVVSAVVRVV